MFVLASGMAHQALFLALPVPLFEAVALVVIGLALGESDFALDHVFVPVQRQGDAGVALGLYGAGDLVDFAAIEQQLARPGGLGHEVGGDGLQRRDQRVEQPGLAIFEKDIAVRELGLARSQTLYFPALQGKPCLEAFFDEIVVAGPFVLGDGGRAGFVLFGFGRHGGEYRALRGELILVSVCRGGVAGYNRRKFWGLSGEHD